MKTCLLSIFLLSSFLSFAQTFEPENTTRALVIGISDYQESNIPDLRFADRDAEAFASFLQSAAGGDLPQDNIHLLVNKDATTGAMAAAMDWLIAESQEGDKAIIYFSGHGDVETRTKFQRGFLLTYDSPPSNYLAGAFALIFLQDIISTLADQGVQVLMISDACRAGKLAGSDIGGSQATAANLAKQFANEIKILSCQPDEFSLEGVQWGGGRGAFSYHLIDGLTGMADNNEDFQVNLFEAGRYLEDKVPAETAPQSQIPITVGSKSTVLAFVDEASLAAVKERKEKESPRISAIDTRGFADIIVDQLDSVNQQKYRQFEAALEKGELLSPQGNSAYDLYRDLSRVDGLGKLKGIMLRNLATKLQEESQQAINAYLRADDEELAARSRGEIRYNKFVNYLEKACELLGPDHYMYKSLKAKQHYFHSVDTRVRFSGRTFSLGDSAQIWQQWCEESMKKALEYEQNAAYLYNEMAILSRGSASLNYYEKAMTMAPMWVVPYVNLISYFNDIKDFKKAEEYFEKGIAIDPTFSYLYLNIGGTYNRLKKYNEAEKMYSKAVARSPTNIYHLRNFGDFYFDIKQYEAAEELWLRGVALSPKHIQLYNRLSSLYLRTKQYDKMEDINLQRIAARPTDGDGHCDLISVYIRSGELEKLRTLINKMVEINSTIPDWEGKTCFGYAYRALGEYELAMQYALEAIRQAPENEMIYQVPASIHWRMGNFEKFIAYVDTMIMKGRPLAAVENTYNFQSACRAKNFEAFAQKIMTDAPQSGFGYRLMGNYYDAQLDFKQASLMYKKAVKLSPEVLSAGFNYARSTYLSGQAKKAKSLFDKHIDATEDKADANRTVGFFYTVHSEYDLADRYLKKAIKSDPQDPRAYEHMAKLLYFKGEQQAAHHLIDTAIAQMKSADFKASFMLRKAELYLNEREPKLALRSMQKAVEQVDIYKAALPFVEKLAADDLEGAAHDLEDLIEKFPNNPVITYSMARLKTTLGEPDAALDYLEQAMTTLSHSYDFIVNDPNLESIRDSEKFKALMRQHFPEKVTKD